MVEVYRLYDISFIEDDIQASNSYTKIWKCKSEIKYGIYL